MTKLVGLTPANLYYFEDTYAPAVVAAIPEIPARSYTHQKHNLAYAKGILGQIWDSAYGHVQSARKKYFALAAIAFAADLTFFGGTVTVARAVLTTAEIATLAVIGTRIYKTSRNDNLQYRNGAVFEPDPQAPEDHAIYQAARDRLQKQVFDRIRPQSRPVR
jgi:hypothetical protein